MPPPAGGDGLLAPIPPSAPQQGGPARPWENAGQAEKVQETSDWLAAQRKKLGMELADGFDPKKAAKESAKQRKKTGEDPLIAKLRGMGAFPRHLCPFQSALPMAGRLLRNSDSDW